MNGKTGDIQVGLEIGQYNINERAIIGYNPNSSDNHRYCIILLNDGMVINNFTKCMLARYLTENRYLPACILDDTRLKGKQ